MHPNPKWLEKYKLQKGQHLNKETEFKSTSNKITVNCKVCQKQLTMTETKKEKYWAGFCSRTCAGIYRSKNKNPPSEKQQSVYTRGKHFVTNKCIICGLIFAHYPSRKNAKFCSPKCQYTWLKGANNPLFKDYKNSEAHKFRIEKKKEIERWRMQVLVRDNFVCKECGKINSMEAHHIKSFKNHLDLRLLVPNGKTLCKECHNKTKHHNFSINSD